MPTPTIITTLWIQRKESYPGEYAPEMLAAADEPTMEDNPDYFRNECDKQLKSVNDVAVSHAVIEIAVDMEAIIERLRVNHPAIPGKVV